MSDTTCGYVPFPKANFRDLLREVALADEVAYRSPVDEMLRKMAEAYATLPILPEWAEYFMETSTVDEGDRIAYYMTYTPRIKRLEYNNE